ncbi:Protein of unknown function [Paenibacillus uliginis N3/975]|uniref:DUF2785 domain-containing protein n=1 Tax=Paenibacillus uliginis N3/975 TaxID=1313296 RepID=A0A1X7HCG9_9BACL|nr:DUF2785 domain-containing protein [Paenibacillus uliginis]SMF83956.1 Protein of unknown function [Paenibacillus uliginis N3/975]
MNKSRAEFMLDLQRIENESYQLREGEQLQDYVTLMLEYIGDPDPELRDNLIYPTFYEWINEENRFTEEQLRNLLTVLTDMQHLFYHIGNEGDQTVFTRTFSVLPIALIVGRHRQKPFLNFNDFQNLKHSLLRYYKEEKDLRGYLPEGGWAHSAAHGADALVELVQCPECDSELLLDVLAAIQGMLHNGIHIFSDEEDERISSIVDIMIDKDLLPQQEITDWINDLAQCSVWPRSRIQVIARVNSKNFLRSLYFRRGQGSRGNSLNATILNAEAKLNRFSISTN